MKNLITTTLFLVTLLTNAQDDRFKDVQIKVQELTPNTYMLTGSGGNILLWTGADEILMVDSQFAPLSDKIKDAIRSIKDAPIKYLVNTHHHGDHTGGNANFNTDKTIIVAHKNAQKRVQEQNKNTLAVPERVLDESLTLSLDKTSALVIHVHEAHTDGDSFIYLMDDNVLHMGDVYFSKKYPFIDLKSGGSIDGYLAAQSIALELINEETIIVPGHGAISNYQELTTYTELLKSIRDRIFELIAAGNSKENIVNDTSITEAADAANYGDGFINSQRIRETIYDSLHGE